jgi:hypothetical protein
LAVPSASRSASGPAKAAGQAGPSGRPLRPSAARPPR